MKYKHFKQALLFKVGSVMDSDAHHIIGTNGDQMENTSPIKIGNHVWIAANCTILKGVVISDNCVVGAGSLVTKGIFLENQIIAEVLRKV